jgi:hypothetical protein
MQDGRIDRRSVLFASGALVLTGCASVPAPSGQHAVGRTTRLWRDSGRPEPVTETAVDAREVPAHIWYPAIADTGRATGYFPDLGKMSKALEASGEVSSLEIFGLQFVSSSVRVDATAADNGQAFPVLLLSPGNGTNVEFYHGLASDLASQGFVVIGVNHPYDVAAAALADDRIAQFVKGPPAFQQREPWIAERIRERTADLVFVLDRLKELHDRDPILKGRLALDAVGALGHSLGGITAAQAAYADARIRACLNLDGLQRGGPFATAPVAARPSQPFMMITKEARLPPPVDALFRAEGAPAYVLIIDRAKHDDFTDGGVLTPMNSAGTGVFKLTTAYALGFFQQTLQGRTVDLLKAPGKGAGVHLRIYPER